MSGRAMSDAGTLLARALERHAVLCGAVMAVGEVHARPWASATFEGERCRAVLYFTEPPTAWLDGLPEAEMPMRGWFVADLVVRSIAAGGAELEALVLRAA